MAPFRFRECAKEVLEFTVAMNSEPARAVFYTFGVKLTLPVLNASSQDELEKEEICVEYI